MQIRERNENAEQIPEETLDVIDSSYLFDVTQE